MKVATFAIAGEWRVGIVDTTVSQTIAPFDLPTERAEAGIFVLIERDVVRVEIEGIGSLEDRFAECA